jgi:hypothetical protein
MKLTETTLMIATWDPTASGASVREFSLKKVCPVMVAIEYRLKECVHRCGIEQEAAKRHTKQWV